MGNNLSMATEFVQKMNKAYGISEKTLMNAQAIFKNMIGSLGQISETTAYNLSEAITQMAIDYSSLYNVSIESAINKFQAALAGQVRPIRSTAGYDITENTLFQLYQSLGGTKTMRQLSRTEKQLLSIYAVFKQMGASGALGDMEKTIDEVSNQTRMMRENWEQMLTWAGVSLQYILKESQAFKYINAILIFTSELLKSIAYSIGYETPDFANSWAENVDDTNKAIDNLQGKLLDFDKFRSLNDSEKDILGIDTKLLEAISNYTSEIGNATSEARKLAEAWMEATFWSRNASGELEYNQETVDDFIKDIETIIDLFLGAVIAKGLVDIINAIIGLKAVLPFFKTLLLDFNKLQYGVGGLISSIAILVGGIASFISVFDDMSSLERAVGIIGAIAAAAVAAAIAFKATHNWAQALMIGATAAGGALMVSTAIHNIKAAQYANGGLPDKGTMFVAGEAGAEIVYNTPSGQSGVANIEQIKQAMYGALVAYGKTNGGSEKPINVYLDGEIVYKNTTSHAKRNGYVWGKA
jgi:hypothetical protein